MAADNNNLTREFGGLIPVPLGKGCVLYLTAAEYRPGIRRVPMFSENNTRQRFLTAEEEQRLVKCSYELGNLRLAALVIAAVDTGFRASELAALKWKDVDLDAQGNRSGQLLHQERRAAPESHDATAVRHADVVARGGQG